MSDPELRLISVWSPSYLKILLDYYKEISQLLLKDMENGTISVKIDSEIEITLRKNYLKTQIGQNI